MKHIPIFDEDDALTSDRERLNQAEHRIFGRKATEYIRSLTPEDRGDEFVRTITVEISYRHDGGHIYIVSEGE